MESPREQCRREACVYMDRSTSIDIIASHREHGVRRISVVFAV